jgi:hypothetical protein
MKVLSWRLSNWWLALIIPIAVILVPVGLLGLIVAGHVGGAILGPPALWNRPANMPSISDVAGIYRESERHWQEGQSGPPALLQLKSDGSMSVKDLPNSEGITSCMLSASGTWRIAQDDNAVIDLTILKTDSAMTCKLDGLPYGLYNILSIAGHSKPYSLYWTLGDPDSGEGLWFQRD